MWVRHRDTCTVYIIPSGRDGVLIDCGDGSVLDHLPDYGVDRVTDVLMTHHHRDQGQGLARLAAAGARIWVPHQEQDFFHSVDAHWQGREVYNSYNSRQDRFSLLEPVPVAGTLQDYATYRFGDHDFTVVPTPGHTTGSITLICEGMAFTGDLIAGPGQVWSLAATQWSYNGGEGIAGSVLSLLDVKDRQPHVLLPSHGEPMHDPATAIDLTVERLASLKDLRRHNPRLFALRDKPYEAVTPHVLKNRTSMSNAYVLLSDSGKALLIDFGYDFRFGQADGADRASRRPWLYTIPMLKRDFGVRKIDAVLPTHYHDDHVAGLNLLRSAEGAQVWAGENYADILDNPARYDLPCLWYDPIPVDRVLPLEQPVQWEEYTLTLYPLPGHTAHAVAIAFEADGKRMLVTGDQWADGDGLGLNYVYKNRFHPSDYRRTAELLLQLKPDLLLSGHWEPIAVDEAYARRLLERGAELERLHADLVAGPEPDVRLLPYQSTVPAGAAVQITLEGADEANLVVPDGWSFTRLGPATFTVTGPPVPARRVRVAADVTVGGVRLGQVAEALITYTKG